MSCQEIIPVKHIFSIFGQFAWNWSDLPVVLIQSAYINLETDLETDQLPCQELHNFDDDEMEVSNKTPAQEISLDQPHGTRLLGLQKKNRYPCQMQCSCVHGG